MAAGCKEKVNALAGNGEMSETTEMAKCLESFRHFGHLWHFVIFKGDMFRALHTGLKSVIRRSALAVAVVLPLALATAVSAALFAIADGLLFRPLPLANADDTVVVSLPTGPRRSKLADVVVDPATGDGYVRAFTSSPLFRSTMASAPGGRFNTKLAWETGLRASSSVNGSWLPVATSW